MYRKESVSSQGPDDSAAIASGGRGAHRSDGPRSGVLQPKESAPRPGLLSSVQRTQN